MGTYSELKAKTVLENKIAEIRKSINDSETEFSNILNEYTVQIGAYMGIDQQKYTSKKNALLQVGGVFSAALSFIPVAGYTASAALNAALTAATPSQGAGLAFVTAAQFNLSMNNTTTGSFASGTVMNLLQTGQTQFGGDYYMGGGAAVASSLFGVLGFYLKNAKPTLGTGDVVVPATSDTLGNVLDNYIKSIEEGYAWIDNKTYDLNNQQQSQTNIATFKKDRSRLLNLVFYNQLKAMKVGGRGNLMLDTGDGMFDDMLLDKYKSVDQVKTRLQQFDDSAKLKGTGKLGESRLRQRFGKYKTPTSYQSWFGTAKEALHLETSICLVKAKILAYSDDYIDQMKGLIGESFVKLVYAPISGDNILPMQFSKSGHVNKIINDFVKATKFDCDYSDHRKDYILGVYAFHSILIHHLGTYNLASLPPYGVNDNVDNAVARALLDALLTQFWVTSRAYKASAIPTNNKMYDDNLISPVTLLQMPYIAPYFNAQRIWVSQGRIIGMTQTMIDKYFESASQESGQDLKTQTAVDAYLKQIQQECKDIEKNLEARAGKEAGNLVQGQNESLPDFQKRQDIEKQRIIQDKNQQENKDIESKKTTSTKIEGLLDKSITDFQAKLAKRGTHTFFQNVETAISIPFLLKLLPTDKTTAPQQMLDKIKGQIEALYGNINIKPTTQQKATNNEIKAWIWDGVKEATEAVEKARDSSGKYRAGIKDSYDKLVNVQQKPTFLASPLGSPLPSKNPQKTPIKSSEDILKTYTDQTDKLPISDLDTKKKLAETLADVHMGSLLSANNTEGFNQADFNRQVARALKLMLTAMTTK